MKRLRIKTPEIFADLYKPARYKVYEGGRGSAKSWQFARALLAMGAYKPMRILCTREIQKSITDSVHRLLSDQIEILNLQSSYTVQEKYIKGKNGTLFLFEGLHQNITKIKSIEAIDVCWVEEAESITERSWDVLIPTIRKANSEIWLSFNPLYEDDITFTRFVKNKQKDTIYHHVTYRDNPFFNAVLRKEMEHCKATNYGKYLHVWEGQPITNYDSLVYRFDPSINLVEEPIEIQDGVETCTGWDFGIADDTAIIVFQIYQSTEKLHEHDKGIRINIVDEYVNNNKPASHYRQVMDFKPYRVDTHYCDPSGAARQADLSTWISKIGYAFRYPNKYSIAEFIDVTNEIMPYIRLNKTQTPKTYDMLRRWQYITDKDDKVVTPPRPEHDEYSHLGTAFYYFASCRFPHKERATQVRALQAEGREERIVL